LSLNKYGAVTLDSVRKGPCRILDISRCEAQRSRLRSIGLLENAVIEVRRGSIGGMVVLLVGESRMGLCNSLASKILVEPLADDVFLVERREERDADKGQFGQRRRYRHRAGR